MPALGSGLMPRSIEWIDRHATHYVGSPSRDLTQARLHSKVSLAGHMLDSQLLPACFADAVRRPLGLPDQVHFHLADVGDSSEPVVYLFEDQA